MALSYFFNNQNISSLRVWTSWLKRTIQTAANIDAPQERWRALNEIDAGCMEHLTYEDIGEKYPEEYAAREINKLTYRYPSGESYQVMVKICKSQYEVHLVVWINLWEILTDNFCQQMIFTVQIKWDINLKSIDFDVIQNLLFCINLWLIFVTFEINLKQMIYDLGLKFMCNRKVYWKYSEFWWLMKN